MTARLLMVINPASGGGRCGKTWWPAQAALLRQAGIPFTAILTEKPGDATSITRRALSDGAETIVAVGGDGTVNETLNGFLDDDRLLNPAARLAFIGAGTGNDGERMFGSVTQRLSALGPKGGTRMVDVMRVRYLTASGEERVRYALLHVALGLIAETEGFPMPPLIKRLGPRTYLWVGALSALRQRPRRVVYRFDGGLSRAEFSLGGVIANVSTFGGGMPVAPNAVDDDGLLDLITLRRMGRIRLLTQVMPRLQKGTHLSHAAVSHTAQHDITLDGSEQLALAVDGDLVGRTPARVTVLPSILPVAVPPKW